MKNGQIYHSDNAGRWLEALEFDGVVNLLSLKVLENVGDFYSSNKKLAITSTALNRTKEELRNALIKK